ncbi:MAG TPA: DUF5011 domain-containing protein [Puia sp.]|nr:DUF5011 domain-containing protein [Puia sp.]
MKIKISTLFISVCVISLLFSCNKTDFNYPPDTVGSSKIIYFPTISLNGADAMSVVKGTTFNDPGAKADVNGTDVPVTTSGTVNTDEVGLYIVTYTAANAEGFTASTQRTVVVIPQAETPGAQDLSGTYTAIGGAPGPATVTKVDQGLYFTTNCWGGGSQVVIPVYFICTDGATLSIPEQVVGAVGRVVTASPGTYSAGLIDWTVSRLDFPGGGLTLEKKWQKN